MNQPTMWQVDNSTVDFGDYTIDLWLNENGLLGITITKDGNNDDKTHDIIVDFDNDKIVSDFGN